MLKWIKKIFNLEAPAADAQTAAWLSAKVVEDVVTEAPPQSLPKVVSGKVEEVKKKGRKKKNDWNIDPPSSAGIKAKKPSKNKKAT